MATWQEMAAKQARRLVEKFGREFTWTPQGGQATPIKGIFDHNYFDATGGDGVQTQTANVQVVEVDAPGMAVDDTWTDGAIHYAIYKLEPDGEGMIDVGLRLI